MLHRLFYISQALIQDPCGPEPRRIIDVATVRNAELQVTGLLWYSGEHFAQVLEGPPEALAVLMHDIRADTRHCVLLEWPAAPAEDGRWYPAWAMGYLHDERLETVLAGLARLPAPLPPIAVLVPQLQAGVDLFRGRTEP